MIYCIEDDQSIRELLAYALQKEGYETRLFEDGSTLLEVISEKKRPNSSFWILCCPARVVWHF